MSVHPTAVVSKEAIISPKAEIGPFCVISGKAQIGAYTTLDSNVRVGSPRGEVIIGEHNHLQAGAALGGPPQIPASEAPSADPDSRRAHTTRPYPLRSAAPSRLSRGGMLMW